MQYNGCALDTSFSSVEEKPVSRYKTKLDYVSSNERVSSTYGFPKICMLTSLLLLQWYHNGKDITNRLAKYQNTSNAQSDKPDKSLSDMRAL